MRRRIGQNSAVNRHAVEAAVQRGQRFVFADAPVELGDLGGGNVRGIGDEKMERLAIDHAMQRRKRSPSSTATRGRGQDGRGFLGDGDGGGADVCGDNDRHS